MPSNVRRRTIHGLFLVLTTAVLAFALNSLAFAQRILDDGGDPGGGGNNCSVPNVVTTNIQASQNECLRVFLTWGGVPGATSYGILRDDVEIGTAPQPGYAATEYFDSQGLVRGQHYTYKIIARNSCGSAAPSAGVTGWVHASPPTISNLQASAFLSRVQFTWTGGLGALQYYFFRDDVLVDTFPGSATGGINYLYSEAECGVHTYGLMPHSCDQDGNLITTTFNAAGGTPTAPVVVGPADGALQCASPTIRLEWSFSGCNIAPFDVQVATDDAFTTPETFHPETLFLNFTGAAGGTYWWRVRRTTTGGTSAYSPKRSFSVGALPSLGNLASPEVVRRINGQIQDGVVYWGELGSITLAPTPTPCPCDYHWTAVNPQNGNFATSASGNYATGYNIGVLANLTYMWHVDMTNGVGTAGADVGFGFIADYRQNGGCPYVAVWDGTEYRDDNNILPASEFSGAAGDVTDSYRLTQSPIAVEGEYRLKLREFEHHRSSFDHLSLLAVDHPRGTEVAVDAAGQVTVYERIESLRQSRETEELPFARLRSPFGAGIRLHAGDAIEFASPTASAPVNDLGVEVIGSSLMKEARTGEIAGRAPGTEADFAMRQLPTASFVKLASAPTGAFDLRIERPMELDAANLVRRIDWLGTPAELTLLSARHDRAGDVLSSLNRRGTGRAELSPGEEIELRFAETPIAPGMIRSFILESRGRYRPVEAEAPIAVAAAVTPSYFRIAAAGHGRLQIDYGLERDAHVTLDLIDVRGRLVQRLAAGDFASGPHTTVWNSLTAASGVYFARMTRQETGRASENEVRKVLILN
jgi:hypothetical protein